MNKTKFKTQTLKSQDEDLDDENADSNILGFYKKFKQNTFIQIPIDEDIKGPMYYRGVVQAIGELGQGDIIQFDIASPGGQLSGLVSLLAAISNTEAHVIANIVGSASSAASILALNCHEIYVSEYATMLVHNASYAVGGKAADIHGYVLHLNDISEKMLKDTYRYFLTDQEIEKVISGTDFWFNAEQITERLQRKQEGETKELEELQELIKAREAAEVESNKEVQKKPKKVK